MKETLSSCNRSTRKDTDNEPEHGSWEQIHGMHPRSQALLAHGWPRGWCGSPGLGGSLAPWLIRALPPLPGPRWWHQPVLGPCTVGTPTLGACWEPSISSIAWQDHALHEVLKLWHTAVRVPGGCIEISWLKLTLCFQWAVIFNRIVYQRDDSLRTIN